MNFRDFNIAYVLQKRLAKEARTQEMQAKNIALGKKVKETQPSKGIKGRGEASFYRVTCKVGLNLFKTYIDPIISL